MIEFVPDGIRGKVKNSNSFFIILEDDEGNAVQRPNNMVLLKSMKIQ